jgi:hypothetical protein
MYDGIENLLIGKTATEILALIGTEDGSYSDVAISDTVKTTVANYDVAISAQGGNS